MYLQPASDVRTKEVKAGDKMQRVGEMKFKCFVGFELCMYKL